MALECGFGKMGLRRSRRMLLSIVGLCSKKGTGDGLRRLYATSRPPDDFDLQRHLQGIMHPGLADRPYRIEYKSM